MQSSPDLSHSGTLRISAVLSALVFLAATATHAQDPGTAAAMQASQMATQAAQQASQQAMQDAPNGERDRHAAEPAGKPAGHGQHVCHTLLRPPARRFAAFLGEAWLLHHLDRHTPHRPNPRRDHLLHHRRMDADDGFDSIYRPHRHQLHHNDPGYRLCTRVHPEPPRVGHLQLPRLIAVTTCL
jgi:hypothetical protein